MNASKSISIIISSILVTQSLAFAQTQDRTEGIGDSAIATARTNISNLKAELMALDSSLMITSESIKNRKSSGTWGNYISVTTASLAVAAGVAGKFYGTLARDGAGAVTVAAAIVSGTVTLGSLASGLVSMAQKPGNRDLILDKERELISARQNVESAISQTKDAKASGLLHQLRDSMKSVESSLDNYKSNESHVGFLKISSEVIQSIGLALTAYSLTTRNNESLLNKANTILIVGGLARLVSAFSQNSAKSILSDIDQTRNSIKYAIAALD
jgi:hypothetical protein